MTGPGGGTITCAFGRQNTDPLRPGGLVFRTKSVEGPKEPDLIYWRYIPKFDPRLRRDWTPQPATRRIDISGFDSVLQNEENTKNTKFSVGDACTALLPRTRLPVLRCRQCQWWGDLRVVWLNQREASHTPNFMIPLNSHQPTHATTPFHPPPINTTSPPTAIF